ncbi:hypothetical protein [Azonexus hydrophilus]|uniref:Uncharacterized protein n=1 Tax=Azonexus hydrophilus TaxID=418702 RepID=A0ABZ2XL39_9RHOO
MSFDLEAYKIQCSAIANAFKDLTNANSTDAQYEEVLASNAMVPPQAVAKIEKEVIVKGSKFRPIDAYQF